MKISLGRISLICMIVATTLIVAGCTGSSNTADLHSGSSAPADAPASSPQDEPVTVTFVWEKLTDEEKEAWNESYIEPFQRKYPHIHIDFQSVPEARDVVKVQLVSGQGPDLFIMANPADLKEYADAGLVADLDPYVKKYGWDTIMFSWALDATKVNGTTYAVPHGYEALLLYYNQDIMDRNGWQAPQNGEQWEEILKQAQAQDLIPIAYGAADPAYYEWIIGYYLNNFAGAAEIKKALQGHAKLTDPFFQGAFETMKQHWEAGYISDKQTAALSSDDSRSLFYQGKALFTFEGSWLAGEVDNIPFNFGVGSFPSLREGVPSTVPIGIGASIAINKSSKSADAAAEFLNFIYTEEQRIAESVGAGLQPLSRTVDAALFPDTMNPKAVNILNILQNTVKDPAHVGYTPWTFFPVKTDQYLYDNLNSVFYGKISVSEYLQGAQEILDQDLKDGFRFILP